MALGIRDESDLGPIQVVVAHAWAGAGTADAARLAAELETALSSWGRDVGMTIEVLASGFSTPTSDDRPVTLADHDERLASEWRTLAQRVMDPTVYLVAILLPSSPARDEELVRLVTDARSGRAHPRYRVFVDGLRPSSTDIASEPPAPDAAVRVLPDLGSMSAHRTSTLLFDAVTEMVLLDLLPGSDADDGLTDAWAVDTGHDSLGADLDDDDPTGDPFEHDGLTDAYAVDPLLPPVVDENVQFTVYRPRAVLPGSWYPLLAFAHLAERRPDGAPDDPDPLEQVKALAEQALGSTMSAYSSPTSDARGAIPRQSELTFVPSIDGVEFNPSRRTFRWLEDVHKEEFRLRVDQHVTSPVVRGQLTVFLGAFILADVDLVIKVDEAAVPPPVAAVRTFRAAPTPDPALLATLEPARANAYRKIFPSYSHQDSQIVEQAERLGAAMGDVYLRDRTTLRSGEDWSERLLELIDEADVFQLFWSSNSMRSPYVRDEWEHAASLGRPNFIRPTYWEEPLPRSDDPRLPPESLRPLHFHSLVGADPSRPEPHTTEVVTELHEPPPSPTWSPVSPARPSTASGVGPRTCPSCRQRVEGDGAFCVSCGAFLDWATPSTDPGSVPPSAGAAGARPRSPSTRPHKVSAPAGTPDEPTAVAGRPVPPSRNLQSEHRPQRTETWLKAVPPAADSAYRQSSDRRRAVPVLVVVITLALLLAAVLIFLLW